MNAIDTTVRVNQPRLKSVVEPPKGLPKPDLRGVWAYRDLFYFLVRRDLAVVYKQTAFGVAWAVLRPLVLAAIYAVIFGVVLEVPSEGIPFPVFVISGLTLWLFFSTAVPKAASSTIANADLIAKVYFPRLVIPLAAVVPPLVDFAIGFLVLEVVLLAYGITPQPEQVFVIPVVLVLIAMTTGAGLLLSAIAVRFRDIDIVVPFILQILLFASAVLYPLSLLPGHLQPFFAINPLVGIMETFRAAMLPVGGIDLLQILPGAFVGVLLIAGGLLYFARVERTIADVI